MQSRIDTAELNQRINLELLAEQDTTLKRKGQVERTGPCPFCGGTDRFNIKPKDNIWLCRYCTEGKWSDAIDYAMRRNKWSFMEVSRHYLGGDAPKFDPAIAAQREASRAAEHERRVKELAAKLSEYSVAERWQAMHLSMSEENRKQWRLWGIPDTWQDYFELGYRSQYSQSIPTPAYTIPYFHGTPEGKKFQTMQYRLTDAPNPADRYRFEFGLPATYFEAIPTQAPGDIAIITEGAKKAMVFQIHIGPGSNASVYALPSKSAFCGLPDQLKERGRVYIILDPDAEPEAQRLAKQVGKAARIVRLHTKLDDGILLHGLDKNALRAAFRWAERGRA